MYITWRNHTVQNTVVLVKFNFLEQDFSRIEVKVLSGDYEESVMLIMLEPSPHMVDPVDIDMSDLMKTLCERYKILCPGNIITYYDERCECEIKCPMDWMRFVKVNQEFVTVHGNRFDVNDFLIEVPLNGTL